MNKKELLEKYKDQEPKIFGDYSERCYPISAVLDMITEYSNYILDEAKLSVSSIKTNVYINRDRHIGFSQAIDSAIKSIEILKEKT